jgi:hypothetical protein
MAVRKSPARKSAAAPKRRRRTATKAAPRRRTRRRSSLAGPAGGIVDTLKNVAIAGAGAFLANKVLSLDAVQKQSPAVRAAIGVGAVFLAGKFVKMPALTYGMAGGVGVSLLGDFTGMAGLSGFTPTGYLQGAPETAPMTLNGYDYPGMGGVLSNDYTLF